MSPDLKFWQVLLWLMVGLAALLRAETPGEGKPRLVSGAGAITETIYALGAQEQLVAVDLSSVYPEEAAALPQIGYSRILSAEGILSMQPSLVLVNEDAGPDAALGQVEAAGVKVLRLPNRPSPESAMERIAAIGEALGRQREAGDLIARVGNDLKEAAAQVAATRERPRVLFVYTRGGALMNVAGRGSGAETMIRLAGGINAVDQYEGYRPLTAEGVVTAAPEVILVTTRGLESSGGIDEFLKQPGLALTKAGRERRVIAMDDLALLGFGPRLGEAVMELSGKLHGASCPPVP
ncbi:MAG TPA: hemin ABC transporter substrate-binding protein [Chthoniobacteraceae bacterium]|nr:hemin ABC transporter substrate-binding protein [Chthoniobacteraceae bacterium]